MWMILNQVIHESLPFASSDTNEATQSNNNSLDDNCWNAKALARFTPAMRNSANCHECVLSRVHPTPNTPREPAMGSGVDEGQLFI